MFQALVPYHFVLPTPRKDDAGQLALKLWRMGGQGETRKLFFETARAGYLLYGKGAGWHNLVM